MDLLIFGATGAAGGSVLRACLDSPHVDEVRAIVRRPLAVTHEKLRVFIHRDFLDYNDAVAEAGAGLWAAALAVELVLGCWRGRAGKGLAAG